jgi:hypothetical protein
MQSAASKDQAYAAAGQTSTASYGQMGRPQTASEAAVECFHTFARQRPEALVMWAFGVGFVLGWKLRIW